MQNILIIYTGGTIGMERSSDDTYHPTSGFEELAKNTIAPLIWEQMPEHEYLEITPAIDSADISPQHWTLLAQTIINHYDDYAGFIVLHGTDTMAYSAAMLSFLLGPIDKTVIFTGSQIPLIEPCSDGANNLLVSLQIIHEARIPEVCIYFANQLFRGNRATKISTSAMVAFESTNYPALGLFENSLKLNKDHWLSAAPPRFCLPELHNQTVAVIYLTPGMPTGLISATIHNNVQGLVLVSYGAGNFPISNHELVDELRSACATGIVIVNVSQCAGGHVNTSYAASKPLSDAGVVSGEDMTIETALTKLHYLLSRYPGDMAQVKKQLRIPMRGELSTTQNNNN